MYRDDDFVWTHVPALLFDFRFPHSKVNLPYPPPFPLPVAVKFSTALVALDTVP